jgi:hypothetical protein
LAGTVEASVETSVSCDKNGVAAVVVVLLDVLPALDVAGAEAAVELLLLLELPQPASASAVAVLRATNKGLGTGLSSCLMVRIPCST